MYQGYDSIPRTAREIFTPAYAFVYEKYSSTQKSTYELGAAILASLAGGIQDGERIGEVGAGTGNSTIVLGESNPRFGRLLAFEPSGMSEIARYKFGKSEILPVPPEVIVDEDVLSFIKRQKSRTAGFRDKVEFLPNRAEDLALPDDDLDRFFACQVMHWLAFSDEDTLGEHPDYVIISLIEFARVLKRGGKFLFDTSGHQFDFGDKRVDGRRIKYQHLLGHPFYYAFLDNFEISLARRGHSHMPIDPDKIGKFHNIFTEDKLADYLAGAGFTIITPEVNRSDAYTLTQVPIDSDDFKARVRTNSQMNLFNNGSITDLPDQERAQIVDEALGRTEMESEHLLDVQCLELIASFACRRNS